MSWGSDFSGGVEYDSYSRNLQDFGGRLRLGFLLQHANPHKARFLDLGLDLQLTPAEGLHYWRDDLHFRGGDHDLWLAVAVRFWDTI